MKNLTYYGWLLALSVITLTSCSKDGLEEVEKSHTIESTEVAYTTIELEILDLVNAYRAQNGLNELNFLNEGSQQAASHNQHMIENDEVCHDYFGKRYTALVNLVKAKAVSENVAYGYSTAEAVVRGWINSESHRENILGDHTHFGISVNEDENGKKYFTNIFVRK